MLKKARNKLQKISFKVATILIVGILLNIVFVETDAFSFFMHEASTQIQVRAASTQSFLERFEVITDGSEDCNAQSIIIRRASNLEFNPIIYFSVEGELANYILHINPVKLEDYKDYEVKINTIINEEQLRVNESDILRGKITIKYLNEFINEMRDIQMTKKYVVGNTSVDVQNGIRVISALNQSVSSISDREESSQNNGGEAQKVVMPEENLKVENNAVAEPLSQESEINLEKDDIQEDVDESQVLKLKNIDNNS